MIAFLADCKSSDAFPYNDGDLIKTFVLRIDYMRILLENGRLIVRDSAFNFIADIGVSSSGSVTHDEFLSGVAVYSNYVFNKEYPDDIRYYGVSSPTGVDLFQTVNTCCGSVETYVIIRKKDLVIKNVSYINKTTFGCELHSTLHYYSAYEKKCCGS